jgi:putative ABC transport system permease protein
MFLYQLRLAAISLRRNPALTALSIGAIALGITVSCAFVTFFYVYSADPIPGKSDDLFYVRLDNWSADYPFDSDFPQRPPHQVTYRDATALLRSDIPTRQTAMFRASVFARRHGEEGLPDREYARFTTGDFFEMFQVPFRYGGGWPRQVDEHAERLVVLDAHTNERYFGGEDSVGERLVIEDEIYTIVGVLDAWRPPLKFYDLISGDARGRPERFFLPLSLAQEEDFGRSGSSSNWLSYEGNYAGFQQSETVWMQMWVELGSADKRAEYQSFLNAYSEEQRPLGRFARPTNNWVQPLADWLVESEATPRYAKPLMWIGLLFLGVCAVNLIGLLLGKFLGRAGEVGVRRALGGTRRSIFFQFLVECWLVSLLGAVLGWLLLSGVFEMINRLPKADLVLRLDATLALVGLALALSAGLVAGVYPAWRLSRAAPAIQLKVN